MARRGASEDPKVAALREARCLNPHPGGGDRRGVPGPRSSSTPATRCRSSTRWCAGSGWTASRSPRRRRRSGTPGRPTTRPPPRWTHPGWTGWCRPSPGRGGAHKLTDEVLAWAEQAAGRRSRACGRPELAGADRGALRRARAPPLDRASAGPPPGAPLQKPLTCPPTSPEGGHPSLSPRPSPGHAAAEPGTRPGCRPGHAAPGGGLDARYEQLRHAALHARAEAFPLGLGVLTRRASPPGGAPSPSLAPAADAAQRRPARHRAGSRRPRCRPRWPPSSSTPWRPSRSPAPEPSPTDPHRPRTPCRLPAGRSSPMLPDTAASR